MLRYLLFLLACLCMSSPGLAAPQPKAQTREIQELRLKLEETSAALEALSQVKAEKAEAEVREAKLWRERADSRLAGIAWLVVLFGLGLGAGLWWRLSRVEARLERELQTLGASEEVGADPEEPGTPLPASQETEGDSQALGKLAALAVEAEAQRNWPLAATRWSVLAELQPENAEAWYRFASALDLKASLDNCALATEWQRIALAYSRALELKPGIPEWLMQRGAVLIKWAEAFSGEDRLAMLETACSHFAEALRLRPEYPEALSNWAGALRNWAQALEGEAREAKLAEACALCAEALRLKPDYSEARHNWAAALIDWAWELEGEARQAKLNEARLHCLEAERVQAGAGAYNLACIAALSGEPDEAQHWLEVCASQHCLPATEHLLADRDLASVRTLPWFGQIFGMRASA